MALVRDSSPRRELGGDAGDMLRGEAKKEGCEAEFCCQGEKWRNLKRKSVRLSKERKLTAEKVICQNQLVLAIG